MEAAIDYSEKDSPSVLWECTLCHSNSIHNLFEDENPIYHHQSDFKDHYDRTCHICLSEFTSKISKDQHQLSHGEGISKTCKSLCSLCGKKFQVRNIYVSITFHTSVVNFLLIKIQSINLIDLIN